MDIIQSFESPNRAKDRGRKSLLSLFELKPVSSPVFRLWYFWFLGFGAKILAYSIASLGSQAFRLE
jgi:hypothetical protein